MQRFRDKRHAANWCPPLPSTGADIHAVCTHRQAKTLIHIKFKHFKSLKAKNPFGSSNLPAHMQRLGLQEHRQPRLRMETFRNYFQKEPYCHILFFKNCGFVVFSILFCIEIF